MSRRVPVRSFLEDEKMPSPYYSSVTREHRAASIRGQWEESRYDESPRRRQRRRTSPRTTQQSTEASSIRSRRRSATRRSWYDDPYVDEEGYVSLGCRSRASQYENEDREVTSGSGRHRASSTRASQTISESSPVLYSRRRSGSSARPSRDYSNDGRLLGGCEHRKSGSIKSPTTENEDQQILMEECMGYVDYEKKVRLARELEYQKQKKHDEMKKIASLKKRSDTSLHYEGSCEESENPKDKNLKKKNTTKGNKQNRRTLRMERVREVPHRPLEPIMEQPSEGIEPYPESEKETSESPGEYWIRIFRTHSGVSTLLFYCIAVLYWIIVFFACTQWLKRNSFICC
ncbi:uncharacterized protein LOC142983749 [Anticarsia gemmatalis]|uniref:uncharacterized protein LOC142983749 n=1 Tax=Anticarsia gemmatalis TaxID=129554 RepID=UPI003F7576A7